MATTNDNRPLIETSFPGQAKATVEAPRHIIDHLATRGDLPFIEPVGKLKEWLEEYREKARKHQGMLDRDEAIRSTFG